MARPRATIFYKIPLPQTLPEKEKWLPDYHKYSEMLMCYLVKRGAQSSVYHTAIRCLTELREYLIDTGNFTLMKQQPDGMRILVPILKDISRLFSGWQTFSSLETYVH